VLEDDPYAVFKREEMILRDWLALDRTVLANKRTFLAYARTAIALVVLGIAFVRLIDHRFFEVAGFVLMSLGIVIFFVGTREYITTGARLRQLLKKEKELERELVGKELCSEKEA
jgi:putative membrane protein